MGNKHCCCCCSDNIVLKEMMPNNLENNIQNYPVD